MIRFNWSIEDASSLQRGSVPEGAARIEGPSSGDEMMRAAAPIAAALCLLVIGVMFVKTRACHEAVASPWGILVGCATGFLLAVVHELLHAIVYPKEASVTVGKMRGKPVFVALASYPMKRCRFIRMCLLPYVLGLVPLAAFLLSPPANHLFNGMMFGMACMGMVSPYPDMYNALLVLKNSSKRDCIMFYEDGLYRISAPA